MALQIDLGDVVAVLALALSAWSMKMTIDFNRRQNEFIETNEKLNQLLIEKESQETLLQKKADVSANFINIGKHNHRLKVFNKGRGTARNVRLEVLDDAELLHTGDIADKFPIPILEQHQSAEVIASVHMQSANRTHIKLIWDDDMGIDNAKELTPVLR